MPRPAPQPSLVPAGLFTGLTILGLVVSVNQRAFLTEQTILGFGVVEEAMALDRLPGPPEERARLLQEFSWPVRPFANLWLPRQTPVPADEDAP